jgi:hypothetical protein
MSVQEFYQMREGLDVSELSVNRNRPDDIICKAEKGNNILLSMYLVSVKLNCIVNGKNTWGIEEMKLWRNKIFMFDCRNTTYTTR